METSIRLAIAKNAAANVARGAAAALVALAVPPFLTRALSPEKYGAWALVLQLAAYVAYLEFGIQTAVGRFVAHTNERSDFEHRNKVVNTALAILSASCLLAMLLLALLIALLPRLFRGMPLGLYPDVRIALVLVGGSLAIGLPFSVFNGIFVGLQRYDVLAAIVAGSRILSAVLLVVIARHGGGIPAMALSMAAVNLASYALQWLMSMRYAPDIELSPRLVSRDAGRELAGYCGSLTVWSFSMLLISGLDLTLVGVFDFGKVAFYAVAAGLVTFAAGLQHYVFSATIPSTAVLHARGDSWRLGRMVMDGTRYGMFLLLVTGLPFLLAAKPILRIWVGPVYAMRAAVLLQILVVANIVRLSAVPYVVTLVGTGQQRLVILTPILEGVANLSISVLAGYYWGAVGVAFGTLCGSFVGVGGNLFYNMPRTKELRFSIREYILESLLRPVLCALPLGFAFLIPNAVGDLQGSVRMLVTLAGGAGSAWCLWRWGLIGADRQRIRVLSRLSSL
jgi:O-antigen/teichoic acid export membrane protein